MTRFVLAKETVALLISASGRQHKGIFLLGNLESAQQNKVGREGRVYPNITMRVSPTYLNPFHRKFKSPEAPIEMPITRLMQHSAQRGYENCGLPQAWQR